MQKLVLLNTFEERNGIRESDDNKCGIRDSREKGRGNEGSAAGAPFETLFPA